MNIGGGVEGGKGVNKLCGGAGLALGLGSTVGFGIALACTWALNIATEGAATEGAAVLLAAFEQHKTDPLGTVKGLLRLRGDALSVDASEETLTGSPM